MRNWIRHKKAARITGWTGLATVLLVSAFAHAQPSPQPSPLPDEALNKMFPWHDPKNKYQDVGQSGLLKKADENITLEGVYDAGLHERVRSAVEREEYKDVVRILGKFCAPLEAKYGEDPSVLGKECARVYHAMYIEKTISASNAIGINESNLAKLGGRKAPQKGGSASADEQETAAFVNDDEQELLKKPITPYIPTTQDLEAEYKALRSLSKDDHDDLESTVDSYLDTYDVPAQTAGKTPAAKKKTGNNTFVQFVTSGPDKKDPKSPALSLVVEKDGEPQLDTDAFNRASKSFSSFSKGRSPSRKSIIKAYKDQVQTYLANRKKNKQTTYRTDLQLSLKTRAVTSPPPAKVYYDSPSDEAREAFIDARKLMVGELNKAVAKRDKKKGRKIGQVDVLFNRKQAQKPALQGSTLAEREKDEKSQVVEQPAQKGHYESTITGGREFFKDELHRSKADDVLSKEEVIQAEKRKNTPVPDDEDPPASTAGGKRDLANH